MTVLARGSASHRARLRVEGTVQGVGFRPFVYRLARELGLTGFVLNDSDGVLVEVQGAGPEVDRFVARLAAEAPPLAVVERIRRDGVPVRGEEGFRIVASVSGGPANAPISPDTAVCPDCLRELLDPGDRRFRYPFINCTNCGPRFTIVTGIPYDRPLTTMAGFEMCARCRREYLDPADRRFHAQPNACPECGPSLSVHPPTDGSGLDPVHVAADALLHGAIVAVKGVGGYHLACRAAAEPAVAALRARKHREDKPFALMTADLAGAERLAWLGPAERELLASPERPIVLALRRRWRPGRRSSA
jgi:hydrogenase maturation protein HypF